MVGSFYLRTLRGPIVGALIVLCSTLAVSFDLRADSKPMLTGFFSRSFPTPDPQKLPVRATKWRKQPLYDIEAKYFQKCPFSDELGSIISHQEKGIEVTIRGTNIKLYMCTNYRGNYEPLKYDDLNAAYNILKQSKNNETILKYSWVTYKGKTLGVLTGIRVLPPASFKRLYALPGLQRCEEASKRDKMIQVPLRMLSAGTHRCSDGEKGLKLSFYPFNKATPSEFILCPDQAKSWIARKELEMDIAAMIQYCANLDSREILITYREYWGGTSTDPKPPMRITGIDIFPEDSLEARLRAWMLSGARYTPPQEPMPVKDVCKLKDGFISRVSCKPKTVIEQ